MLSGKYGGIFSLFSQLFFLTKMSIFYTHLIILQKKQVI